MSGDDVLEALCSHLLDPNDECKRILLQDNIIQLEETHIGLIIFIIVLVLVVFFIILVVIY